jgi:hypothetical protein
MNFKEFHSKQERKKKGNIYLKAKNNLKTHLFQRCFLTAVFFGGKQFLPTQKHIVEEGATRGTTALVY